MADINTYITRPSFDDPERMDRHNELTHWNRDTAMKSAAREGMALSDEHWKAIVILRRYYLEHGWPTQPHILVRELDKSFSGAGGTRYLYRLFPRGPLAQGARIAGLPVPVNVTDKSFGSVQ
ncbi:MAG: TusE/DsrC/DsvC family sulfur relay protein [Pseudomonadota bacterium]|nr:TusE/DsrC/DsvC family sulfur relay protein [Pseudomonadota bacterium]